MSISNLSSENEIRDYLFLNHKETLGSIVRGRKADIAWTKDGFPPISFLLQEATERRIHEVLDSLETLVLDGKEVRLERENSSATRIDLLGRCVESSGLTIIELKKSKQTERQAFTELMAYANHFCTLFPTLGEDAITTILIAPMDGRTVRDAHFQQVALSQRRCLALVPKHDAAGFYLEVHYPDASYYRWFENKIIHDQSFSMVVATFPQIDGWIDCGAKGENPPQYSVEALNTISLVVARRLEAAGLHGLVYARQYWSELADVFPEPNAIVVSVLNPFSSFRNSIENGEVYGDTPEGRISEIQALLDQMEGVDDFWMHSLETDFSDKIIRLVRDCVELCLLGQQDRSVHPTISVPLWAAFKVQMLEAVTCHNLQLHTTGLLREIYEEYIRHIYKNGIDNIFYSDDLPYFAHSTMTNFLAVWEILSGLSLSDEDQ